MRRLTEGATALAVAAAVVTYASIGALAESLNPGTGTVSVGAPTSGGSTNGTAGYGDGGISAAASINDQQGGVVNGGGTYHDGGYTFKLIAHPTMSLVGSAYVKPADYPCPPGETGYDMVSAAGTTLGIVCVPNPTPGAPGSGNPVLALAQLASSRQPWPSLGVYANPADAGVTGIPAWFWLGQGVATIAPASATAGPLTVTVRAALTNVVWDFGDGSPPYDSGSSIGKAYPQASDVVHTYQTDSFGLPSGYSVVASLRFTVEYSVNGGGWTPFGTKIRTYQTSYVVNQAQPEAVPGQ